MKIGLSTWCTDYSIGPDELARAAEERGFESLFFPDHTHVPVNFASEFPDGEELPKAYYHGMDPIVCMSAAAAVTTRLRVGTGVCLIIERDPILLAKQVATIDHLSGGRVELGIGAGWSREEMANHGTDHRTRFTLMRERVEAMREIWTNEKAEYHGNLVNFDPLYSWPKPVQPRLPVLIGGSGPKTLERVVEYGDGWIPPVHWVGELADKIAELRRLEADAGKGPSPVTVMGVKGRVEAIKEMADIGVERIVISLPVAYADEILPRLDNYVDRLGEWLH